MNSRQRKQAERRSIRLVKQHVIPLLEEAAAAIENSEEPPAEVARLLRELVSEHFKGVE